jgi:hypothetical protein
MIHQDAEASSEVEGLSKIWKRRDTMPIAGNQREVEKNVTRIGVHSTLSRLQESVEGIPIPLNGIRIRKVPERVWWLSLAFPAFLCSTTGLGFVARVVVFSVFLVLRERHRANALFNIRCMIILSSRLVF